MTLTAAAEKVRGNPSRFEVTGRRCSMVRSVLLQRAAKPRIEILAAAQQRLRPSAPRWVGWPSLRRGPCNEPSADRCCNAQTELHSSAMHDVGHLPSQEKFPQILFTKT
jgi:hypothetical protein